MKALARGLRLRWETLQQRPFMRLLRQAIERIAHGGDGAEEGVDIGIGVVLGVLAAPGAFLSLALTEKYGSLFQFMRGAKHFDPYAASLADEYFFVVLSMIVAGSVAVWKWDSLLPNRRDYANLAHLPIPGRNLFLANLSALLFLALLLSVDINAASSVLFPLIACSSYNPPIGYVARFFATHVLAVTLAAAFGFLGVLSIVGALMALLPYRIFRKLSIYVRSTLLIFFAASLMTTSSEPHKLERMEHTVRGWQRFPPGAWFVALCQWLRGIHSPLLGPLAKAAVWASLAVPAIALCTYAISYKRCFLRSAEAMITLPAGGGRIVKLVLRWLDAAVLRGPVQRAGYRFVVKTLFRSEPHALTWIGFTAVGLIVVSNDLLWARKEAASSLVPSTAVLAAPLILLFFLMFGLRLAFV